MILRARQLEPEDTPGEDQRSTGQAFITPGVDYEAQALGVFDNRVEFQVVDDRGDPSWEPALLFDVIDLTIPGDWICNALREGPQLLLGPAFIAESQEALSAFEEYSPEPRRLFWKRFASLKAEREAASKDEWRQLGFYFTFDVEHGTWLVAGSRKGILAFCDMLLDWAATARHQQLPGYRKIGPRQDLKFVLSKQPRVRRSGLHGRPEDFERLATLVKESMASGQEVMMFGSLFMGDEAAKQAELEFRVGPDDFDPGIDGPATRASRKALWAHARDTGDRRTLLRKLLELEGDLEEILKALAGLSRDIDLEISVLRPLHVTGILQRYLTGELAADDVEKWANAVQGRKDIELAQEYQAVLAEVMSELTATLTPDLAKRWVDRLSATR